MTVAEAHIPVRYIEVMQPFVQSCDITRKMNHLVSIMIWMMPVAAITAGVVERPLDAVNGGRQALVPAAPIPVQAPKKELRYQIRNENGAMMMSFHNDSDEDLGIKLGVAMSVLGAGKEMKIPFPNLRLATLMIYKRCHGDWVPLFAGQVPQRVAKAAFQFNP